METIQTQDRKFIFLMLATATLFMLALTMFPFLVSVYLSFTDYSLIQPDEINAIGFANYASLLSSTDFWVSLDFGRL